VYPGLGGGFEEVGRLAINSMCQERSQSRHLRIRFLQAPSNRRPSRLRQVVYDYGVDLVFGAHEHAYERFYPVYQSQWDEMDTGPEAYVDYDRPVSILTGAAGCPENMDIWQNTTVSPSSVFRTSRCCLRSLSYSIVRLPPPRSS